MRKRRFVRISRVALFGTLACVLLGFLVMTLWNILMPGIFALRPIGFWQALGLLVLSKLLFGGFRSPFRGGPGWRRHMIDRWERMTPEEREKFKQGMRGYCGIRRSAGAQEAEAQS